MNHKILPVTSSFCPLVPDRFWFNLVLVSFVCLGSEQREAGRGKKKCKAYVT